jgi:murein DD-endopeptidase MepM/ murein hydrolase activator NlpD
VPARAPLNLDRPAGRADAAPVDADITGVSDLLDFGSSSDAAPAAAPTTTRRSAQRSEPTRETPRSAGPARRWAPQAASRPAARPAASAPRRRRGTRQLASLVAMSFAALLAVATTIPSLSLLTPEDVQALALSDTSGFGRDGQRVTINGDVVAAQGVQREGYEHMSMSEVAEAAGIRAEADFVNNPAGTIQWPFAVGVHIGDHFGYRDCAGCSSDHGGQDFNPGLGAEIQAIADGTVAVSTDSGGSLGVVMMIDHQIDGELVTSVYAHMIEGSRRFEVGDTVHVADVIGQTGNTACRQVRTCTSRSASGASTAQRSTRSTGSTPTRTSRLYAIQPAAAYPCNCALTCGRRRSRFCSLAKCMRIAIMRAVSGISAGFSCSSARLSTE